MFQFVKLEKHRCFDTKYIVLNKWHFNNLLILRLS